jgi:hypothetical protein
MDSVSVVIAGPMEEVDRHQEHERAIIAAALKSAFSGSDGRLNLVLKPVARGYEIVHATVHQGYPGVVDLADCAANVRAALEQAGFPIVQ